MKLRALKINLQVLLACLSLAAILVASRECRAAFQCYDCHGTKPPADYRPLDAPERDMATGGFPGSHRTHMAPPASPAACAACHPGSGTYTNSHRNGYIKVAGHINASPLVTKYRNITTAFQQNPAAVSFGICTNVNCHFENTTPVWGSDPAATTCSTCHGAPPSDGSHPKHGVYYSLTTDCGRCHTDHTAEPAPFAHATSVTKRPLRVAFSGANAGGSYSGTLAYPAHLPSQNPARDGSCSGLYCHSPGDRSSSPYNAPLQTPQWGSSLRNDCTGCHGNNALSASPMASGSHGAHVKKMPILGAAYSCGRCHNDTVDVGNDRTITGRSNHVDGTKTVVMSDAGIVWSQAGATCSNITCHPASYKNAAWGETACLSCHSTALNGRAAISPQFSGNSHHIQGAVTDRKCYQCHWEANSDGTINPLYHGGSTAPGSSVDLVVFGSEGRPNSYDYGVTAVQYHYTTTINRQGVKKITTHCLGCHNDQNKSLTPFEDGKTPNEYAWDGPDLRKGTSIAARYTDAGYTTWGKYSTAKGANKKVTKAFSAHGNAVSNKRGWSKATGVDGAITDTGAKSNVECYDCHNSHGSAAAGITSRYSSATGRNKGGILKSTVAGKGGYALAYQPYTGGSALSKSRRNPGASICLDCHLNRTATDTPWGFSSTFEAMEAILGYWDKPMYKEYSTAGSQKRFAFKGQKMRSFMGGHFGAYSTMASTPAKKIDGLCTPCHDPHGVSPTLNRDRAVPLLKGTWVTSPYKEDTAPTGTGNLTARSDIGKEGVPFTIDQNLFGTNHRDPKINGLPFNNVTTAAGLCVGCHTRNTLTRDACSIPAFNNASSACKTNGGTWSPNAWKSKNRIHEAVEGWKTSGATAKHSFTCSKCHSPHSNATLPRLMVTNCMDTNHKGRAPYNTGVLSGRGDGWAYVSKPNGWYCRDDAAANNWCGTRGSIAAWGSGSGRIPGSWSGYYPYSGNGSEQGKLRDNTVVCHDNETKSATDQSWNLVTPWYSYPDIAVTAGPTATVYNTNRIITWSTNIPGTSVVNYGPTTAYGSTTNGASGVVSHSVTLPGSANPDAWAYYFQIKTVAADGQQITRTGIYDIVAPTVTGFTAPASTTSYAIPITMTGSDNLGIAGYKITTSSSVPEASASGWSASAPTTFTVNAVGTYTLYPWVKDAKGNVSSAYGTPKTVAVQDVTPPPASVPLSPASGSTNVPTNIRLTCTETTDSQSNPVKYYFQLATDSGFTTNVQTRTWSTDTSFVPVLAPNTTYYWRVNTQDSAATPNNTGYSGTYSFTTTSNVYLWTTRGNFTTNSATTGTPTTLTGVEVSGVNDTDNARVIMGPRPIVSAGNSHTLIISGGTVWASGYNSSGELGNGTNTASAVPVQVKIAGGAPLTGIVAVQAGSSHSLALRNDGTVWAWGANASGQLGNNTWAGSNVAVQVKLTEATWLTGVIAIAAGNNHSVAVKADGTIWTWGANGSGQLGLGDTTPRQVATQVSLADVRGAAAGASFTVMMKNDGTVWAAGDNSLYQLGDGTANQHSLPVQTVGISGVIAVAAKGGHAHALKSDGTVWSWGSNFYGELGDGSNAAQWTPVQVQGLAGMIGISAGEYTAVALKGDGTAWSWGYNGYGNLGDGTMTNRKTPVQVQAGASVQAVAAGANHSVAVLASGSVKAWGYNYYGQLGDGSTVTRLSPVSVAGPDLGSDIKDIGAGYSHSLAVKNDGTVWAWGQNFYGQLGDGTKTQRMLPVQVHGLTDVTAVAAGTSFSLALKNDGSVWAWGSNANGQLGDPVLSEALEPVQVSGLTEIIAIAAGSGHSLALKNGGSVWGWGNNGYGQLGDNTNVAKSTPVQAVGLTSGVTAIAAAMGGAHSLAVKDGAVWAWGSNWASQLGNNSTNASWVPINIGLSNIVEVAAGGAHSLARMSNGNVYSWGYSSFGQLGDSTTNWRKTPVQVPVAGIVSIAAGGSSGDGYGHSLAVTSGGTVYVWGLNNYGQLGDGTTVNRYGPVPLATVSGAAVAKAGRIHSLIKTTTGSAKAWGMNENGQLGDGTSAMAPDGTTVAGVSGVGPVPGTLSSLTVDAGSTVQWDKLYWNATTAGSGAVKFEVRGANTAGELTSAPWSSFFTSNGSALGITSRWLEIRVTQEAGGSSLSELEDVAVTYVP